MLWVEIKTVFLAMVRWLSRLKAPDSKNPHNERREPAPASCSLTSTDTQWHAHPSTY